MPVGSIRGPDILAYSHAATETSGVSSERHGISRFWWVRADLTEISACTTAVVPVLASRNTGE